MAFKYDGVSYRIDSIWTPILIGTPPSDKSNRNLVKTSNLGQKSAKIGQIFGKFELNPTQKPILKNRTPEL